jgi:hypothetical protein
MNSSLHQWAIKWTIPFAALQELNMIFNLHPWPQAPSGEPHSEAHVQSLVRLEAAHKGLKLWRNNVGVLQSDTGVPVRYGLANDSPKLNAVLKSGDLIGWRPILILPHHVGGKIAQFVSRECKRPGWNYSGTEREQAQLKWVQLVTADGGDAQFVTAEGSL